MEAFVSSFLTARTWLFGKLAGYTQPRGPSSRKLFVWETIRRRLKFSYGEFCDINSALNHLPSNFNLELSFFSIECWRNFECFNGGETLIIGSSIPIWRVSGSKTFFLGVFSVPGGIRGKNHVRRLLWLDSISKGLVRSDLLRMAKNHTDIPMAASTKIASTTIPTIVGTVRKLDSACEGWAGNVETGFGGGGGAVYGGGGGAWLFNWLPPYLDIKLKSSQI